MTWLEVLKSQHQTVTVETYGYMERSLLSSHFEPFSHKREFEFKINRDDVSFYEGKPDGYLYHPWLRLEEVDENNLVFEERDGKLYLDDPDLWARPD